MKTVIWATAGLVFAIPLFLLLEVRELTSRIDELESQKADQIEELYYTADLEWSA